MTDYVFDPARLTQRRRPQADPCAVAGRLLRDYLGGDPLADARRKIRSDPNIRAQVVELRREIEALSRRIRSTA